MTTVDDLTTVASDIAAKVRELRAERASLDQRELHLVRILDEFAMLGCDVRELVDGVAPPVAPDPPLPVPPPARTARKAPAAKKANSPVKRSTRTAATPKRDHAEVARVAIDAHAKGASMGDAVADHFGIGKQAAYQALTDARRKGHAIPKAGIGGRKPKGAPPARPEPRPEPPAPEPPLPTAARPPFPAPGAAVRVLECNDCEFTCDAAHGNDMMTHTLRDHGRTWRKTERTPVERAA